MQRLSLGSPNSKLQFSGGAAGGASAGEEEKRAAVSGVEAEAEEVKAEKPFRPGAATSPELSIHLIPVLTLLCLLILYLCSHDPSPKDLASMGGAARLIAAKAVSGVAEVGGVYRGLKVAEAEEKRRHRKLGPRGSLAHVSERVSA